MSITKLAEGRTYYGTDVPAVLNLLDDGDKVVVWVRGGRGFRGMWSGTGEGRNIGGWYIHTYNPVEVTVISLSSRRPEWADALVVRDRNGDCYLRRPDYDNDWTDANGTPLGTDFIARHAPITVVVDADGQVRP